VGAQLQRIYGTYAVSRLLGALYLHSPLFRVDYQGLSALEENVNDPRYHDAFNELCWIDSDVLPTDVFRTMEVANLTTEVLDGLETVPGSAGGDGGMCLLKVTLPYGIADRFPDCYDVCKEISPFASVPRRGRPLRVAIHVRQGDLMVVESHRMLPHGYFVAVAQHVAGALDAVEVEYQMELHSEIPTREFAVTPGHVGIGDHISAPVVVNPEMSSLHEFSVLPSLKLFVNERAIGLPPQVGHGRRTPHEQIVLQLRRSSPQPERRRAVPPVLAQWPVLVDTRRSEWGLRPTARAGGRPGPLRPRGHARPTRHIEGGDLRCRNRA